MRLDGGLGPRLAKEEYKTLLTELQTAEPKYWGYDSMRAYSLLPRWHGQVGEWEAYAEKAAARPGGFGDEIYARIVINQASSYRNIFKEANVSWTRMRAGLELMRRRCPEALDIVSVTAKYAYWHQERDLAKAMFERLDDTCDASVWTGLEEYRKAREWAQR